MDDLTLIEKRLENWFVNQSQSSVQFTGNVKKRFDSLPVDTSHVEFGTLSIARGTDGVITGIVHNARNRLENLTTSGSLPSKMHCKNIE